MFFIFVHSFNLKYFPKLLIIYSFVDKIMKQTFITSKITSWPFYPFEFEMWNFVSYLSSHTKGVLRFKLLSYPNFMTMLDCIWFVFVSRISCYLLILHPKFITLFTSFSTNHFRFLAIVLNIWTRHFLGIVHILIRDILWILILFVHTHFFHFYEDNTILYFLLSLLN